MNHFAEDRPSSTVPTRHFHRGLANDARFMCRKNIEEAAALNDGVIPEELTSMLPRMPHAHTTVLKKLRREVRSPEDSPAPSPINTGRRSGGW